MTERTLVQRAGLELSGNVLKIIAAVAMTVDHVGLVLFPTVPVLRQIGRLALPIFAFMIAEGCAHTRNALRYFLSVLTLGLVCQTAYTVAMGSWYLCMPLSFSLAIALVLALRKWKSVLFDRALWPKLLWGGAFLSGVAAVWVLTQFVRLDYGFWGCMLPVAASLFRKTENTPRSLEKLDRNIVHILAMGVCMVMLALCLGPWQWWSMLALPFLKLYSGRRGKHKMKYFFYIFYPAHLLVIQGIFLLLTM